MSVNATTDYRLKALAAKLEREQPQDTRDVVPGYALVQMLRQAMKETVRHE